MSEIRSTILDRISFVICGQRTGSTLFSRIVDSHSMLASPFEFAIPSLLGRFHWKYRTAVKKSRKIATHYELDAKLILPNWNPWDRRHVVSGIAQFAEGILCRENKQYLLIKEPAHCDVSQRIAKNFGISSVILLARSPITTASALSRTFEDPEPLKTWVRAHAPIAHLFELGAPLIRYEELVREPVQTATKVCGIFGVPFEVEMLDYSQCEHAGDQLRLWNRKRLSGEAASVTEAEVQVTLARGIIDPAHDEKLLADVPVHVHEQFQANAFDAKQIAMRLGYGKDGLIPELAAQLQ